MLISHGNYDAGAIRWWKNV